MACHCRDATATNLTTRPVSIFVELMRSTVVLMSIRGFPCQLFMIKQNSLCSTLSHLDVPGGKWDTCISSPVSSANSASSYLHNLTRQPSQLMYDFFESGNVFFPTMFRHLLILSTAKALVSGSLPRPTRPRSLLIR